MKSFQRPMIVGFIASCCLCKPGPDRDRYRDRDRDRIEIERERERNLAFFFTWVVIKLRYVCLDTKIGRFACFALSL